MKEPIFSPTTIVDYLNESGYQHGKHDPQQFVLDNALPKKGSRIKDVMIDEVEKVDWDEVNRLLNEIHQWTHKKLNR